MTGGLAWRDVLLDPPPPAAGPSVTRQRFLAATLLAAALHALLIMPALYLDRPRPAGTTGGSVELSPAAATATSQDEDTPPAPGEALQAVAPEETTAAPPDITAPAPTEVIAAPAPTEVITAMPPPDPVAAVEPSSTAPPAPRVAVEARRPALASRSATTAASGASTAETPSPAATPTVRPLPASYLGELMTALERHKEYPAAAQRRQAEGVAILRFTMRRDGGIVAWRIERSAGDEALDAAVERMLRRATPLPPPPIGYGGDTIEFAVPVRFSLH